MFVWEVGPFLTLPAVALSTLQLFSGRVLFDTLGGTMIFDAIVELRLPKRPNHVQLDDAA